MSSFRKEARSALDEKDFERAVSVCDYGLEVDKNDYLLLVFRGLAMKNMENYNSPLRTFFQQVLCRARKAAPCSTFVGESFATGRATANFWLTTIKSLFEINDESRSLSCLEQAQECPPLIPVLTMLSSESWNSV